MERSAFDADVHEIEDVGRRVPVGDRGGRLPRLGDQRKGVEVGGVRGQDRVRRGGGVDGGVDGAFDVHVLNHGLDNQLSVGDRLGDVGGGMDTGKDGGLLAGVDQTRLDQGVQRLGDQVGGALKLLGRDVLKPDLAPPKACTSAKAWPIRPAPIIPTR